MIADILHNSQHTPCKISPENFYIGHLIRPGMKHAIKKIGDMSDDANVYKLVDYMYEARFTGTYWQLLKSGWLGIDKEVFLRELLNCNRSDKEIYEVFLRVHPEVTEDTVLGDKNPGHLYHVPTLMEWFPQAKVIHTFRDPRAILASEWAKRVSSKPTSSLSALLNPFHSLLVVLHVTVTWLYAVRLHYRYQKQYPQNYYLSKYEDIVTDPDKSIRQLCDFLEVQFHPEMLKPRKVDSSYLHDEKGSGFDQRAITRWQQHLKPWMSRWLSFWGKKYLREFGYTL